MHPILGDRRRLAFYLLVWLVMGLLLTVTLRGGGQWFEAAAFFLPLTLLYAVATLSAWYVCRAYPLPRSTAWHLVTVHALAGACAAVLWTGASGAWARTLDWLGDTTAATLLYERQRPLFFVVGALLFWLIALCGYLLIAFEASRDAERKTLELTLLAREAELKALRAQIDPHFIFNSLHSISALTASDPAAARRMCLLLADFLRDTLRLGSAGQISLAQEFALADRFLAIEQIRLGARLTVERDTNADAGACLVPPLLLQPLVENAIHHGVAQLVEGGTIQMSAARDGSTLTITLANPYDPDGVPSRGVGLGLELLRKRLAKQYGAHDVIQARQHDGRFIVEIRLPAVTAA